MRSVPAPSLFRDDFTGGLGRWQPNWLGPTDTAVTPPINGAEVACYDPALVSVGTAKSGVKYLSLKAVQHDAIDFRGKHYSYASGCVTTRNTFLCEPPCRVEAHVWLPGTTKIDNWPAFWADGTGTWPSTGELDVVEGLGGHAAYHFHSPAGGPGGTGALAPRPGRIGWHRFVADWRHDHVQFAYDGQPVGVISEGITSAPMFLILNLALSPTISPPVVTPSEMRCRLVEVSRITP